MNYTQILKNKKLNLVGLFCVVQLVIILSLVFLFSVSSFAIDPRAQDPLSDACPPGTSSSVCQPTTSNPLFGPSGVITRATEIMSIIVGIAAVIMIIIGGFKYITSSGDPSNTKSAKDTILYAVIGLVVAAAARIIALFVMSRVQ